MKILKTLIAVCFLTVAVGYAAEISEADQKWLQAVEKMVTKGETKLSTPSEGRVALFKEWAEKKGYSVKVTKFENGFSLEVASKDASKNVAQ
jgi:hypothetical protein